MAAAALSAQAQSPESLSPSRISGRYHGELASNGRYLPVTTFLKAEGSSRLSGHYVFVEPGDRKVGGELVDCSPRPPLDLACEWHDPYGAGRVVFTFASNLLSFKGRWSGQPPQGWFPWGGIKQD